MAWAVLLAAGCGLEQPGPTLREVAPAAVCGGGAVTLTLSGDGFVALPTDVLGAHTVALPRVILDGPMRLELGDDAAGASGPVTYVSTQSLTVTLDAPPVGQYAVSLVNPDGQASALDQGFSSSSPAPVVVQKVDPGSICSSGTTQTITLSGSGFLAGSTVTVLDGAGMPLFTAMTNVADCSMGRCNTLSFDIPNTVVPIGSYVIEVDSPAGGGCEGSARAALAFTNGPRIDMINPTRVCVGGGGSKLTITGSGFAAGATVQLVDAMTGSMVAATATVDSATQITAMFMGISPTFTKHDTVDLLVTNPDGCAATLPGAVHVKPGGGGC